jgi:hypothetical protein
VTCPVQCPVMSSHPVLSCHLSCPMSCHPVQSSPVTCPCPVTHFPCHLLLYKLYCSNKIQASSPSITHLEPPLAAPLSCSHSLRASPFS